MYDIHFVAIKIYDLTSLDLSIQLFCFFSSCFRDNLISLQQWMVFRLLNSTLMSTNQGSPKVLIMVWQGILLMIYPQLITGISFEKPSWNMEGWHFCWTWASLILMIMLIWSPSRHFVSPFNKVERGVYWFHIIHLSVWLWGQYESVIWAFMGQLGYSHIAGILVAVIQPTADLLLPEPIE